MESSEVVKGKADVVVLIKSKLRGMGGDLEPRLLRSLPPKAASAYLDALPVSWLPCDDLEAICDCAARMIYPDDSNPAQRLGHDSGIASYTGVYRVLIRVATVPYLMEKAASLWKNHYTAGTLSVERTGFEGRTSRSSAARCS